MEKRKVILETSCDGYHYRDSSGTLLCNETFSEAERFTVNKDFALVCKDSQYGLLHRDGHFIFKCGEIKLGDYLQPIITKYVEGYCITTNNNQKVIVRNDGTVENFTDNDDLQYNLLNPPANYGKIFPRFGHLCDDKPEINYPKGKDFKNVAFYFKNFLKFHQCLNLNLGYLNMHCVRR